MAKLSLSIPTAKVSLTAQAAKIRLSPTGTVNPVTLAAFVQTQALYGSPISVEDASAFVNAGGMWGAQITTDSGDPVVLG